MKKEMFIAIVLLFVGIAAPAEQTPATPQTDEGELILEAHPAPASAVEKT